MRKRKLVSLIGSFILSLLLPLFSGIVLAQEELTAEEIPTLVLTGDPLTLQKAVEITLQNSTEIETAGVGTLTPGALNTGIDSVKQAEASYQMASSQFDFNISMAANAGHTRVTDEGRLFGLGDDTDSHTFTTSLSKSFRTGISSSISISSLNRSDTRNVDSPTLNSGGISANVSIPLLKGRGSVSAAASETQARLGYEMAQEEFFHTVSKILLDTVKAYWDYKAAVARLKVQEDAEQRVQQWIGAALAGVEGNLSQYSEEVDYLEAYLKYKRKNTLAAMEEVTAAKGALAKVMGIPQDQMKNIGEPVEVFPEDWASVLSKVERNQQTLLKKFIDIALKNRFDLKATRLGGESSAVALAKAERDVLPSLSLGFDYSSTGYELHDGFGPYRDSLSADPRSADLGATLSFSYTIGNRLARGQLTQAQLGYKASSLNLINAERQTAIDVSVTAETVLGKMKSAVQAKEAVDSYLPAIEKFKGLNLRSNPEAIFDLIVLEKRINEAEASPAPEENSYINSLLDLAKAIAQLRFDTATMVKEDSSVGRSIELYDFTRLPAMD